MRTPSVDNWKHLGLRRDVQRATAITVLCAVGTVWNWRTATEAAQRQSQWGATHEVVVATELIEPGEKLTAANTATRQWPARMIPDRSIAELPTGAVARHSIGSGQGVDETDIVRAHDSLYPLAARDTLAITLPNLDGEIAARPGDHVEIFIAADNTDLGPSGSARDGDAPTSSSATGTGRRDTAVSPVSAVVVARQDDGLVVAVDAKQASLVAEATLQRRIAVLYDPVPDN